jgi:hypothetical protein
MSAGVGQKLCNEDNIPHKDWAKLCDHIGLLTHLVAFPVPRGSRGLLLWGDRFRSGKGLIPFLQ